MADIPAERQDTGKGRILGTLCHASDGALQSLSPLATAMMTGVTVVSIAMGASSGGALFACMGVLVTMNAMMGITGLGLAVTEHKTKGYANNIPPEKVSSTRKWGAGLMAAFSLATVLTTCSLANDWYNATSQSISNQKSVAAFTSPSSVVR